MEAGQVISLQKRSFWKSAWDLYNAHGGKVGAFRVRRMFTYRAAEGEAAGKTLMLRYTGWSTRRGVVEDEWGHVLGTMHRSGWCGTSAQLILYEKEYVWRANAMGTRFAITHTDGAAILSVSGCGGFGTRGEARFAATLPDEEALILAYMGLYQLRLYEMEVAASTAILAGSVAAAV